MTQNTITLAVGAIMAAMCIGCSGEHTAKTNLPNNYVDIKSFKDLSEYFKYSPERPTVISGHRGGTTPPEKEKSATTPMRNYSSLTLLTAKEM